MEVVKANIKVDNIRDFLKIILKIKSVEENLNLSESHLNLIVDFYFNGINASTYDSHILQSDSEKNYFKSKATIDNAKTYLKKINVLTKNNQGELTISPDFLPPLSESNVVLELNVLCI